MGLGCFPIFSGYRCCTCSVLACRRTAPLLYRRTALPRWSKRSSLTLAVGPCRSPDLPMLYQAGLVYENRWRGSALMPCLEHFLKLVAVLLIQRPTPSCSRHSCRLASAHVSAGALATYSCDSACSSVQLGKVPPCT
jgi:hypothetical protein